jgi:hypothetical protein
VPSKSRSKKSAQGKSQLDQAPHNRPFRPTLEGLGLITLIFAYMVGGSHNVLSYWIYAVAAAFSSFGLPFPKRFAPIITILAIIVAGSLTFETLRSVKPVAAKEQPVIQPTAQLEKQSLFIRSAKMEPLVPGKPPVAKIAIQNGRGETTLVVSNASFVLTHLVPEKYLKYQTSPTMKFVFGDHTANMAEFTGNQIILSQDDINDLNAEPPMAELYVFAKGEYSTDAGKRRLDVCRKYYKPSAPELSFCADDIKIE